MLSGHSCVYAKNLDRKGDLKKHYCGLSVSVMGLRNACEELQLF